jgi:tRNA(Arg) A34 adenosine deaminase TadA
MRAALSQALRARRAGEPPFGAVLVDARGAILAAQHDRVRRRRDMTRHAEVAAVRDACRRRGADLAGCTLYTTCEPCPMCFTAAWLARVSRIVYGTTMAEVLRATGGEQRELAVPTAQMNRLGGKKVRLVGGMLGDECLALFTRRARLSAVATSSRRTARSTGRRSSRRRPRARRR